MKPTVIYSGLFQNRKVSCAQVLVSSPADFVTFCEIFCGILPSTDFLSNGSGLRKNKQTLK